MVDAFYTPAMLILRGLQSAHRKMNRTGATYAGGKKITFDEYKVMFSRFHRRYHMFKCGGQGLSTWACMSHSKYTVGMGFVWGIMNFNWNSLALRFIAEEILEVLSLPQGPDCATNIRTVFIAAVVFLNYSGLSDYEVLIFAYYIQRTWAEPFIMSVYSSANPRATSLTKVVFIDGLRNIIAGVFSHIPYATDLFRLTQENHGPYLCSLSLHMSTFKCCACVPFAIYNNIDSPFKNSRALVSLPWLLFDFPAVLLLMKGCVWDNSLVYGVDRTPNLNRVVPLAVAGALHVWALGIIPFVSYDILMRCGPKGMTKEGGKISSKFTRFDYACIAVAVTVVAVIFISILGSFLAYHN